MSASLSLRFRTNVKDNEFRVGAVNEFNVGIVVVPQEVKSIFVTLSETAKSNINFVRKICAMKTYILISRSNEKTEFPSLNGPVKLDN